MKAHLNVSESNDAHDSDLASFIAAAREEWEHDTSQALIDRTIECRAWRWSEVTRLQTRPVQSIESISYVDADGTVVGVDATAYYLDDVAGEVLFLDGFSRPYLFNRSDAVRIRYVAGYGENSTDVPELDRLAIKVNAANRFEFRDMGNPDGDKREAYERLVLKKMRSTYP
jgi:uncharacterized phiE125 gp8 family phage protein